MSVTEATEHTTRKATAPDLTSGGNLRGIDGQHVPVGPDKRGEQRNIVARADLKTVLAWQQSRLLPASARMAGAGRWPSALRRAGARPDRVSGVW